MMPPSRSVRLWLMAIAASSFFGPMASAEVVFEWVTVGGAGNACDVQLQGCFGAVSYKYQISKYEVTNAQYTEFLNAVAERNVHGLYHDSMNFVPWSGGITQHGVWPGPFTYSAIAARENMPVNWVSFRDATRFANWLHNGQPTGPRDNTTTEDGAYTLTQTAEANNTITRNAGATVFLPSEDEWYKAAYYDPTSMIYYDYPAGSDTPTACTVAGTTQNTANCDGEIGDVADVGSYSGAPSPNGTFDQGGNVEEWNEWITRNSSDFTHARGMRGGDFQLNFGSVPSKQLGAFAQNMLNPVGEFRFTGIRVARLIPAVPSLGPIGFVMLLGLLGLAGYWQARPTTSISAT